MNVIRSIGAGVLAGAVGTAAMDLVWYRRYRRAGGNQSPASWESGGDITGWHNASAPGQVGRKLSEQLTGETPPDSWARPTTNAVHWATGVGWGSVYAVAHAVSGRSTALAVALGPTAWITSYALLPLLKVYQPIWRYDARTLAKDLSAHLVFGVVTASAFALLGTAAHSKRATPPTTPIRSRRTP